MTNFYRGRKLLSKDLRRLIARFCRRQKSAEELSKATAGVAERSEKVVSAKNIEK